MGEKAWIFVFFVVLLVFFLLSIILLFGGGGDVSCSYLRPEGRSKWEKGIESGGVPLSLKKGEKQQQNILFFKEVV